MSLPAHLFRSECSGPDRASFDSDEFGVVDNKEQRTGWILAVGRNLPCMPRQPVATNVMCVLVDTHCGANSVHLIEDTVLCLDDLYVFVSDCLPRLAAVALQLGMNARCDSLVMPW